MLDRTPDEVRECHDRAAECRRRAESATHPEMVAFWREQEARWLTLAESNDLSARIAGFLESHDGKTFSPEAEEGVQTLVDIFECVCRALTLDPADEALSRKVARTIIQTALGGENDPERLFAAALKVVVN